MRLINADAIRLPKGFFEKVDNVPKFYNWLNDQPTIDPVKHGKWIAVENDIDYYPFMCSVCYETVTRKTNYCPNCGAEMRKVE